MSNRYTGGRGSYNNRTNVPRKTTSGDKDEIKFVPFYAGKQQTKTYDTVKEHIILQIQKTYKSGSDIVEILRSEVDATEVGARPIRERAEVTGEDGTTARSEFEIKLDQDGKDLEYTDNL